MQVCWCLPSNFSSFRNISLSKVIMSLSCRNIIICYQKWLIVLTLEDFCISFECAISPLDSSRKYRSLSSRVYRRVYCKIVVPDCTFGIAPSFLRSLLIFLAQFNCVEILLLKLWYRTARFPALSKEVLQGSSLLDSHCLVVIETDQLRNYLYWLAAFRIQDT